MAAAEAAAAQKAAAEAKTKAAAEEAAAEKAAAEAKAAERAEAMKAVAEATSAKTPVLASGFAEKAAALFGDDSDAWVDSRSAAPVASPPAGRRGLFEEEDDASAGAAACAEASPSTVSVSRTGKLEAGADTSPAGRPLFGDDVEHASGYELAPAVPSQKAADAPKSTTQAGWRKLLFEEDIASEQKPVSSKASVLLASNGGQWRAPVVLKHEEPKPAVAAPPPAAPTKSPEELLEALGVAALEETAVEEAPAAVPTKPDTPVHTGASPATALEQLRQILPACAEETLRRELAAGGSLDAAVNRILEAQEGEHPAARQPAAAEGATAPLPGRGPIDALTEARAMGVLPNLASLTTGALRITARVCRTVNELEEGVLSDTVVTKFIIEVKQLDFTWEVAKRYSDFDRFHLMLMDTVSWATVRSLPRLPQKFLFVQGCTDIAERMEDLGKYLRALLAIPQVARCPLFCEFLDAVDPVTFERQTLPRLRAGAVAAPAAEVSVPPPTTEMVAAAAAVAEAKAAEAAAAEAHLSRVLSAAAMASPGLTAPDARLSGEFNSAGSLPQPCC
uniref:PX domain-containing protein n=1 Tax=Haptolina ericina TaxID=156174 RepID=A0A7S3EW78_9EUKA